MKHGVLKFSGLILLFPVALMMQWICRGNAGWAEYTYSRNIYPAVSSVLSAVFGLFPFSTAEVLLIALVLLMIFWITESVIQIRRTHLKSLFSALLRFLILASVGYFLFIFLWGLNYCREPLSKNLGYKEGAPSKTELADAMNSEIDQINALCPQLSYSKKNTSYYSGGLKEMLQQANQGFGRLSASESPKNSLFSKAAAYPKSVFPSGILSFMGIQGIYIPFTFEPTVDGDYPDFILPFAISHETAHFKGFAREDEANFVAYLADCENPDIYYQYSAHMNALIYLSNALYSTDQGLWKQSVSKLDKRASADIDAYNQYVNKHTGAFQKTADKVNDYYLKSQGQSGVESYDRFVTLLVESRRSAAG